MRVPVGSDDARLAFYRNMALRSRHALALAREHVTDHALLERIDEVLAIGKPVSTKQPTTDIREFVASLNSEAK